MLKIIYIEEATLKVYSEGGAKIIFKDDSEYIIDGIFVHLRL